MKQIVLNFRKNPKLIKGDFVEYKGTTYEVDCCVNMSLFSMTGFKLFLTKV